jgi:hypothetical protein
VKQLEFPYDELLLLKYAVEALYRWERGEKEKMPFYETPMAADQWETLLKLRRTFKGVQ